MHDIDIITPSLDEVHAMSAHLRVAPMAERAIVGFQGAIASAVTSGMPEEAVLDVVWRGVALAGAMSHGKRQAAHVKRVVVKIGAAGVLCVEHDVAR